MRLRNPTEAMVEADAKRIASARAKYDAAWDVAMTGCPGHVRCGDWLAEHPSLELDVARSKLEAEEQRALSRGTHYRASFNMLTRVD